MVRCDRVAVDEINQMGRSRRASSGIMTTAIRVHHEVQQGSRRRLRRQAAHVVIPKPVEHQRDQVAGGGHHADVVATALGDAVATLPQPGARGHALHGLDRGPTHQPRARTGPTPGMAWMAW